MRCLLHGDLFLLSVVFVFLLFTHRSPVCARRIVDSRLGLNEIAYHDEPSLIFLGSPSLVRLPSGRLLASHDFFGSGYTAHPRNVSVYSSEDDGQSWRFFSWIVGSY